MPSFRQWMDHADQPPEYILSVHERDLPALKVSNEVTLAVNRKRYCSVDNWNRAAEVSTGAIIILNADDFFPPPHWDSELSKVVSNLDREFVVHVSTGCPDPDWEDRLITLGILSRKLYDRWGHALYPEYESMDSDVDFTERAYLEGVVIEARHLLFEHRHYVFGKSECDDVYRWQNRPEAYALGHRVLDRRRRVGFLS
jgi:hypothetical protein